MLRLHKVALSIGLTEPQQKAYFAKLHSLHIVAYENCEVAKIRNLFPLPPQTH